ncbi:MAG: hypothetical protein NTY38_21565 [Acidobacteria bacterium]|nr:hypothetical protein [Acidobacteriota bacterium]
MKQTWVFLRDKWCYLMHPDPMWPVNGQYRCPACQHLYPVPWETGPVRWSYAQRSGLPVQPPRTVYLAAARSRSLAEVITEPGLIPASQHRS